MSCCKGTDSPTDIDKGTMLVRDSHLPIIWVFGGPCSGKSSVCQRITEKYQFMHIDCDAVLRFEAMTQSSRGLQISSKLNRRERIPDDILVKILREVMPRNVKLTNGYLLDNFPANVDQARLFEKKICNVTALLYMKVSNKVMGSRFVDRRGKERQGHSSNDDPAYKMPTVDDIVLRSDRIEVQIKEFEGIKPSVLNEYANVLHVLNAGKKPDAVFHTVDSIIFNICKSASIHIPEVTQEMDEAAQKDASATNAQPGAGEDNDQSSTESETVRNSSPVPEPAKFRKKSSKFRENPGAESQLTKHTSQKTKMKKAKTKPHPPKDGTFLRDESSQSSQGKRRLMINENQ